VNQRSKSNGLGAPIALQLTGLLIITLIIAQALTLLK